MRSNRERQGFVMTRNYKLSSPSHVNVINKDIFMEPYQISMTLFYLFAYNEVGGNAVFGLSESAVV